MPTDELIGSRSHQPDRRTLGRLDLYIGGAVWVLATAYGLTASLKFAAAMAVFAALAVGVPFLLSLWRMFLPFLPGLLCSAPGFWIMDSMADATRAPADSLGEVILFALGINIIPYGFVSFVWWGWLLVRRVPRAS